MRSEGESQLAELGIVIGAKTKLRNRINRTRQAAGIAEHQISDIDRNKNLIALLQTLASNGTLPSESTIACYLSKYPEPGTLNLVDHLLALGHRVIVPLIGDGRKPNWATYDSTTQLHIGRWQIPEPEPEQFGQKTNTCDISQADLIICAALAVGLDGTRLGTGGGWYDRALSGKREHAKVVALINDAEIFDCVPTEPHDQKIDFAVTPSKYLSLPSKASS